MIETYENPLLGAETTDLIQAIESALVQRGRVLAQVEVAVTYSTGSLTLGGHVSYHLPGGDREYIWLHSGDTEPTVSCAVDALAAALAQIEAFATKKEAANAQLLRMLARVSEYATANAGDNLVDEAVAVAIRATFASITTNLLPNITREPNRD